MSQNNLLRLAIRQSIKEALKKPVRKFMTFEGTEVEYGSQSHVDEYEQPINELVNIRKQLKRSDRKEQDRITRCLESLRHLRKKAYKLGLSSGLIQETDDQEK